MAKQDQDKNLYTLSLSIVAVVALVAIVSLVVLLTGGRSVAQYVAPSVEQAAPIDTQAGEAFARGRAVGVGGRGCDSCAVYCEGPEPPYGLPPGTWEQMCTDCLATCNPNIASS